MKHHSQHLAYEQYNLIHNVKFTKLPGIDRSLDRMDLILLKYQRFITEE